MVVEVIINNGISLAFMYHSKSYINKKNMNIPWLIAGYGLLTGKIRGLI